MHLILNTICISSALYFLAFCHCFFLLLRKMKIVKIHWPVTIIGVGLYGPHQSHVTFATRCKCTTKVQVHFNCFSSYTLHMEKIGKQTGCFISSKVSYNVYISKVKNYPFVGEKSLWAFFRHFNYRPNILQATHMHRVTVHRDMHAKAVSHVS